MAANGNIGRDKREDWQEAFLEAYARLGRVIAAADEIGVSRTTVWSERQRDEDFALRYTEAHERYVESVRAEILRRAMGWEEPVFDKDGNEVGTVSKHSDLLLIFEAKRIDPAYRDTYRVEHSGPDGGPIRVQAPPDAIERSRRAAALLSEAGGLPDVEGDVVDEDPPANGNGHR